MKDVPLMKAPTAEEQAWMEEIHYAGFGMRFAAFLLDSILFLIPLSMFLGLVFNGVLGDPNLPPELSSGQPLTNEQAVALLQNSILTPEVMGRFLIENLVSMSVFAAMTIGFWMYCAGTPGKVWLGMKIVDAHTFRPTTPKQDLIRYFTYLVSMVGFMMGFMSIMWDRRSQGWHDKFAGTVVVFKRSLPEHLRDLTARRLKSAPNQTEQG